MSSSIDSLIGRSFIVVDSPLFTMGPHGMEKFPFRHGQRVRLDSLTPPKRESDTGFMQMFAFSSIRISTADGRFYSGPVVFGFPTWLVPASDLDSARRKWVGKKLYLRNFSCPYIAVKKRTQIIAKFVDPSLPFTVTSVEPGKSYTPCQFNLRRSDGLTGWRSARVSETTTPAIFSLPGLRKVMNKLNTPMDMGAFEDIFSEKPPPHAASLSSGPLSRVLTTIQLGKDTATIVRGMMEILGTSVRTDELMCSELIGGSFLGFKQDTSKIYAGLKDLIAKWVTVRLSSRQDSANWKSKLLSGIRSEFGEPMIMIKPADATKTLSDIMPYRGLTSDSAYVTRVFHSTEYRWIVQMHDMHPMTIDVSLDESPDASDSEPTMISIQRAEPIKMFGY